MRRNRRLACVSSILFMVLASISFPLPAPAAEVEFKLVSAGHNPVEDPLDKIGQVLRAFVKDQTKGRVEITHHPSNSLAGMAESVEMVKMGTLDIDTSGVMYCASMLPWAGALDLPFIFDGWEDAWKAYNGWIGDKIRADLEAQGVIVLGIYDIGFRSFGNKKRPIVKFSDMAGLKMRTFPSDILPVAYPLWGVKPTVIGWGEVPSSLESGLIDGLDNAPSIWLNSKMYEQVQYLSLTRHLYGAGLTIMSKKSLSKLPKDLQGTILECGKMAALWERQTTWDLDQTSVKKLREAGMKINDVSPALKSEMQKALKPLYEKSKAKYGKELIERLVGK